MKFLFRTLLLCLLSSVSYAQTVYQIRADSVRIYSACDTAELIIENHTQDTTGFLFNKGKGRTEFRKLRLKMLPDNSLAIVGQDTIPFGSGFVKLQTVVAQPGGFSVAGSGFSTAQFQVKRDGSDAVSGGLALFNAIQTRGTIFQLNGDVNPGVSTWIHNGVDWVKRMEINAGSGVVDIPYGFIAASGSKIRGTGTGITNFSYLRFTESDGITSAGYIGKGGSGSNDLIFLSDKGNVRLSAKGAGNPQFEIRDSLAVLTNGMLLLSNGISNNLVYAGAGVGAPTFNTRSVGTKITFYTSLNTTNADYGIGLESAHAWFSVPQNVSSNGWKFYGGTTQVGRIDGVGSSEWSGQGRFKGWYLSGNGTGPAAEVGYTGGAAVFAGADRTAAAYIPVQLIGGNSPSGKVFTIDGTGYRLNQLTNAGALGTDANGYLKDASANYIRNIDPYSQDSAQTAGIFIDGAIGSKSRVVIKNNGSNILGKGYELRPANMGEGGALFQLNGDAQAGLSIWLYDGITWRRRININAVTGVTDFVVTPTVAGSSVLTQANHPKGAIFSPVLTGSNVLASLLTNDEGHVTGATTRSLIPADIAAAPAAGSVNYVQAQGANPQAISFNISGTGIAQTMATGAPIGGEDLVVYKSTNPGLVTINKRWVFYKSGPETGGNAGSNLAISRYDDNGKFLDNPLQIARVNGDVVFATTPKVGPVPLWIESNHPAGNPIIASAAGAKVLDSLVTNSAGHVKSVKTRTLTVADINAAPASGSGNYIQYQTVTPQNASFNISGTGTVGGNLTVGGNEVVTGSVTATGFNQSSLRALKMNIKTCELNATRIIDSLKIREFEYKKEPGRKVVGIIADDESSIISGEKHDHLDMMNAVGLLLKSVQELNARVEKLEQQINKERSSK
jgi:hypothetical protein